MSSPNLIMLETVARALGSFTQEVVFVGGATVSLYLQNPASPEVRPTEDVDCIIKLSSYSSYAEIESRMRKLGFEHDMSRGAPICRWLVGDIKVDVMPTDGAILGFTNRWYLSGVAHKIPFRPCHCDTAADGLRRARERQSLPSDKLGKYRNLDSCIEFSI